MASTTKEHINPNVVESGGTEILLMIMQPNTAARTADRGNGQDMIVDMIIHIRRQINAVTTLEGRAGNNNLK